MARNDERQFGRRLDKHRPRNESCATHMHDSCQGVRPSIAIDLRQCVGYKHALNMAENYSPRHVQPKGMYEHNAHRQQTISHQVWPSP